VYGSCRTESNIPCLLEEGITGVLHYDTTAQTLKEALRLAPGEIEKNLKTANLILVTVPPEDSGDPIIQSLGELIPKEKRPWVGYLSSASVYGDHQGALVDESSELKDST